MRKTIASKISSNFLDLPAFTYLGETFQPCRQFTKKELKGCIGRSTGFYSDNVIHKLNYVTNKYNYNEFYKAAKEVGADQCDIFLWHGKQIIPCSYELFYLSGEAPYKNEKEIEHEKEIKRIKRQIKFQEDKIYKAKVKRDDLVFELSELNKII